MGMCKDPVTQELNKRGYNLVKLPRVGIEPLDVLGRDGDSMEKLGSVAEVWTSSVPAAGARRSGTGRRHRRAEDRAISTSGLD